MRGPSETTLNTVNTSINPAIQRDSLPISDDTNELNKTKINDRNDIENLNKEREDYINRQIKQLVENNKKFEQDIKIYKIMKDKNDKNKE